MNPIWIEHYPPGVPPEASILRFASLKDLLEQSCERFRARPAFTNMGVSLSYDELDRRSREFGAWLQHEAGLKRGERVAIMLPNLLQYPVALFGALRAGMVVVNVNPLYTARELQHQLSDSGATAIVVLENFAHTLQEIVATTALRHVITTRVGDLMPSLKAGLVNFVVKWIKRGVPRWQLPDAVAFNTVLGRGARHRLAEVPLTQDDIAFLQYTGGTTGVAKGAILTHGNLVANVEQTSAWIGNSLKEGEEVVVTPLPLYHVFALTANLLTFVKWGANDVLITNPRDIPGFIKELRKTRFTVITGVNTLYHKLLDAPGFERVKQANAGALKLAVAGGMSVQRSVAERWQQQMGVPLIEGYGLTEASPIVCANPLDAREFSGAIGMPIPSTRVDIRDEAGNPLPLGEAGELWVQGPQVMRGYWNMPDETARVLSADRWLRTGDICQMDADGMVRFVERAKDVVVVSGFKVYPNEVEAVLMLHPGVREAGVAGVPDEASGEAVKAFVVKRDPALTAAELVAHCRANLAAYKVPKQVEFRDRLPKSPIGKVLRRGGGEAAPPPLPPLGRRGGRLRRPRRLIPDMSGRRLTATRISFPAAGWLAHALAFALVATLAGCAPARHYEALRVLQDFASGAADSRLKRTTPEPLRQPLAYTVAGRAHRADLYLPAALEGCVAPDQASAPHCPRAAIVAVPGAVPQGKDDPRMVAFATTLARAGFAVMVPDLAGYRQLRIRPADALEIADAFAWVSRRPQLAPDGRAGMFAFSYSVGPAVLAALQDDIREQVRFVVGLGGYYDLPRAMLFFTTGWFEHEGAWQHITPDDTGRMVLAYSSLDYLAPAPDRAVFDRMVAQRLRDPRADLAPLAAALSAGAQAVYALAVNDDPARFDDLFARLPPAMREDIARLDLARHDLAPLRARLILVHGLNDNLIPWPQSRALAAAAPARQARVFLIRSVLGHVDLGVSDLLSWRFWREELPDLLRLWRVIDLLLAEREAGAL